MSVAGWFSLAAVCLLGAMSPGPSLAVVVRHALAGSRLAGVTCAAGHAFGVGLHALLSALGLAALLAAVPVVYGGLVVAGALYLAWLGIGALRGNTPGAGGPDRVTPGPASAARDGLLIALLNPKIAVFFVALFSQFVRPGAGPGEVFVLWATATGIDGAWYALVAVALTGRGLVERLRGQARRVDLATGILLLGLAAWTLVQLAGRALG